MGSQTVRISRDTHGKLRQLAKADHTTMQAVLAQAIEDYRRKCYLEAANASYRALRKRPRDWAIERTERKVWEGTLADRSREV